MNIGYLQNRICIKKLVSKCEENNINKRALLIDNNYQKI